ncbi:putative disease resistance protein [Senna tora]|uniref:Putative disease resistance protein n=1 Tax=Senna tora TaxID=362788 RepID=A0A834XCC6_9FABA|nr:putative disease resistance protein [Senna tora]
MAMEIGTSLATKVAETCIDKAMMEAGYLCCFKSYVEDYEKEQSRLLATRESLQKDINEARQRNEIETDDETKQWLKEANDIINVDTKAKKKWFGFLTDCIWQYKRGKELAGKTLDIPKLMERRNNLRIARPVGAPGMEYHSSPDFIQFESRKAKFEQLKEALKNSNNHMIGLQGMGGTGKTTMATQVGKEFQELKLFDKVIFTVVSNPPNVEKIRSDIAKRLVSQPEYAKNLEDADSLWSRISNGGEKILIILDDVWQELNLKAIGIPLGFHQKGHCNVLVTTRSMTVCKKMECQDTINLELLSEEDALNLFLLHAGVSVDSSSTDIRNIASNIVKECGRLPVAIVPVAKTLKSESPKDWEAALIRLQNVDPTLDDIDEDLIEVYKSLRLSYDNLKSEKAKELFLLCSLFPEDFELPTEEFSRIAIGLGLCGNANKYYIARSQVPEITHKLIDSSLLLKADKDECLKMHDLVREVAQWIGKEEIQVIMDSKTILKENIRYSFWNIDGFPNHFDGKKVEFLRVEINAKDSMELPDEVFKDMIRLRVLIFIAAPDEITPSLPLSFHSLRNIRTLILERWKLGDISIMGSLQSLETLELTFCKITKLPNEIQALEKLRLLGLKYCEIERDNPFNVIEGIPKLEELYYVQNRLNLDKINEGEEINLVGTFRALQRYQIIQSDQLMVNASAVSRCFSPEKLLKIFSEAAIKELAARADCLVLEEYHKTGWTNLIPDIVPMENGGMNRLLLYKLSEIECVIHTKNLQSGVPIFSKIVELKLFYMDVKELCCGPLPTDFLKQLKTLCLRVCMKLESTLLKGKLDLGKLKSVRLYKCSMSSLFHPSTARSLKQLETLSINYCDQLKYIITNERGEEEKVDADGENIFPSLEVIDISHVPNFIHILECQPQSHHHKSSPTSATVRDGLNIVKDGSPTYTLSWAPLCCFFRRKPSATTIDNTFVSEPTLPNSTSSQVPLNLSFVLNIKEPLAPETEVVLDRVQCLLRPPLNPHNMREMTISHCSNITSLFTLPIASSMLFLEKLKVKKCHGLKHLITHEGDGHDRMNKSSIFPKLKKLSIKKCRLLESLFPATHCTTFDHLVSVKISRAHKLRYVFGKCYCNDMLAHHNRNVEIHLPTLNILFIHDVPNMVNFCYENSYITALSLKGILLIECPQLPFRPLLTDFTVCLQETQEDLTKTKAMKKQLENLGGLALTNVKVETIYDLEGLQVKGQMKSMLENVWLKNLAELRYICVGLRNILSLPNLSELEISGCKKLKAIFSKSISRSLPQLEKIFVTECEELVQIIEETEQNPDLSHQECFPNLTKIHVKKCKRLKCVFSISTCGVLPNLEELKIEDASELKQVFGYNHDEEKEMAMKDVFPKLETLVLQNLPSLDCVCQGFDFETVPERFVRNCPNISLTSTITISYDEDVEDDPFEDLLETSSEDEEGPEDQSKSSEEAASQSMKEATEGVIDEDLHNNNTSYFTESNKAAANEAFKQVPTSDVPAMSASSSNSIPQQNPSLEVHEKKPRGDREALDESLSTNEPSGRVDRPANEVSSKEGSNKTALEDTSPLISSVSSSKKPQAVTAPTETEPGGSKSNHDDISCNSESPQSEKEAAKEVVDEDLEIQEQNSNTSNLTESHKVVPNDVIEQVPHSDIPTMATSSSNSDMSKEREEASVQEGLKSENEIRPNEIMDSEELSKASPAIFLIPLQNESPQNINASVGDDGYSSKKYNKPSSSTHCSITTTKGLNEIARGVDIPLDNTHDVEEPTNECSSEERSNITTAMAIPPTLVEMKDSISSISSSMKHQTVSTTSDSKSGVSQSNQATISRNSEFPQDKIIVNQTEIDNPKQIEEDDLIRLFQIMEEGADMEVHKPIVSKFAVVEEDNNVAKAFADLEVSLKMGLNEIATSEENILRLQNALNLLSNHFSEDGPPSHGLSATIDSLHQEFQSILSSFKQASSTIHTFNELEEKEKCMINEELPQRKQEAKNLVSEIFKTEKAMVVAQQKEAELKEQISRLQAELKSKEKEINDCEMKLLYLQEQKKKSVSETMRFMKDFEDVKKDKSLMMEEEIKARQELEKVDAKWSSCVTNLRKTTLLLGIHLNHNL